jgi:membrane-associated phospholipid phosphatase
MYKGDTRQLRLVRRSVLISLYCGYLCYIFIPVSGPLSLETPLKPLWVQSSLIYSFLMGNFRFPTDCFPSLHTANPWLMVWICRSRVPGWMLAAGAAVCALITMSTIALRFHYGVDVLAGLVWIFPISVLARATLPRETAD